MFFAMPLRGISRRMSAVRNSCIAAGKIAPRAFPPQSVYAPKSSAPRLSARCREAPTVPRMRLRKLYIRYKECCRTGSLLTYLDPQLPFSQISHKKCSNSLQARWRGGEELAVPGARLTNKTGTGGVRLWSRFPFWTNQLRPPGRAVVQPLDGEEKLAGDFAPADFRHGFQQIFGRPPAIRRHRSRQRRLPRIQPLHRFPHPLSHQAFGDQIAPGILFVGDMYGHQPAFAVRVLANDAGVGERLGVDFHHFAFGGRDHFGLAAIAVEGEDFLSLADPLAGFRQLNLFQLAQQGGGEFIGAHPHHILALAQQPGMTGVVRELLGNQETVYIVTARLGRDCARRIGRHRVHHLAAIQHIIQYDEDQESSKNQNDCHIRPTFLFLIRARMMPNFADFCASMCRDFKQIRIVVFSNGPGLLMNPTAPLSNFEVTRPGMSGLGRLLLNPTARLEMPTVLGADSTARLIGSRAASRMRPDTKVEPLACLWGQAFSLDSAGINRREVVNERVIQERSSEPS